MVFVIAIIVGGWCVFGTQLKAVGTIEKPEEHLYAMEYRGDHGFDGFLAEGGEGNWHASMCLIACD